MNSYIERVDTHDHILWLPPLPIKAAAILARLIEDKIGGAKDWNEAIQTLSTYGFALTLQVEHHGPQDYRSWSLSANPGTWAKARLAEAINDGGST